MKNYELLFLLPASLTGEEVVETFGEVRKNLEKQHATFLETLLEHPFLTKAGLSKEEETEAMRALPIVKRRLAYPIKHEQFGYYCLVNFSLEAKYLPDVDEYLRHNGKVLRHLLTAAEPMTREELDKLHALFARKKAEQEKEEAEKNKARSEERKETQETETKEALKPEEKTTAASSKQEKIKTADSDTETKTPPETEAVTKKMEVETKEVEPQVETSEPAAEIEPKPAKKSPKKNKIKLEELEDKLDAILEDTVV